MGEFLVLSLQSQGRACRALAPRVRLRPLLQLSARHIERQDPRDLQGGRTSAGRHRPSWAARMSQPFRLAGVGSIDRSRPLAFTFDGLLYQGYDGDTLASALIANGVHLVGRSFKYHRPRGILSAGAEEPNALITVTRDAARVTPNLRATQVELYEGLAAESQNRWPSLAHDFGRIND